MELKFDGDAKIAVQIAISSAFVEDGQSVVAQPYCKSKLGMYQPEPIMTALLEVRLDMLSDPSVYISKLSGGSIVTDKLPRVCQ